METDIDKVSIEIDSNSQQASSGLEGLKQSVDKLYNSLDVTINKLDKFNGTVSNLQNNLSKNISLNVDTSSLEQAQQKISSISSQQQAKVEPIKDNGAIDKISSKMKGISYIAAGVKGAMNGISSAVTFTGKAGSKAFSTMSKSMNAVTKVTQKIKSGFSSIKDKMSGFFKGNGMDKGIKKLAKYAMALFSIRGTYALLNSAANRWLSSSNAAAQQLSANMEYLKFAAGSALAPVIEYLVNLVYKFLKGIQSIIYYFTGINIFAKAFASDMKSAAGSAKEAAKSLAPFDELNVIDFGKASGGGGGDIGPSIDLTQVEKIDSELLRKIKEGNWYEVGFEISSKLNEAMEKINWSWIQEKAELIATNIANFINGAFDGLNWELLGNTIAQGLNTALIFVNTLLTKINFENIGTYLSTGLNSMIEGINWDTLGETIGNAFNAVLDFLHGAISNFHFETAGENLSKGIMSAVKTVKWDEAAQDLSDGTTGLLDGISGFIKGWDWQVVGDAIVQFFSNIKWGEIVTSLFNLLGNAAASLVNLGGVIGGYINDGINNLAQYFTDNIMNAGGDIVKGLFDGIINGIANINQWLDEHICQPFINGFKDVFQIGSPSKVMERLGGFITDGLKEGVKGIWEKVKSIFTDLVENIKNKISSFVTNFKNKFEELKNNIIEIPGRIKNAFIEKFDEIKNGIKEKIDWIKQKFTDFKNDILNIPDKIKNAFSNMNIKIKMPHFEWSTTPAQGWIADILGALNLPKSLPKLNVSWYETGGFPEMGQLFIANEAGPELVGNIGNRAAVANNDQIIEGIARASYEGVSQAMRENASNQRQQTNVYIGNKKVYSGYGEQVRSDNNMYGTSTVLV